MFRVVRNGVEQRWIATLLHPERIASIVETIAVDERCEHSLHACLEPDSELGVTLVVVTAEDSALVAELDDVAVRVAAAIFVEELWCAAMQPTPDHRRKDTS